MSGLEVVSGVVRNRKQSGLRPVVGDPEQRRDLLLVEEMNRGPRGSEPAGTESEHETPRRRQDRSVRAGLSHHHRHRFDTTLNARNHVHRNAFENLSEIRGRLHDSRHHVLTRITGRQRRRISRTRHHLSATSIGIGDGGPLGGIGHHDERPVLRVRSGRGLERDVDALAHHVEFDRSIEIESFAHRSGGGQQFVR